jgi:hypothetical protein
VREKMEGGTGSVRDSAIQSLKIGKTDVYETIELLLSDREFRILCKLENGVYRDVLVALLKRVLRPASFKDANDFVSDLIQIGVLEVELRDVEVALPKQLLLRRRRTKKGVKEVLQKPKGFEVVGESQDGNPILLLRTYKQLLKPSEELRRVCSYLATSRS